MFYVHYRIDKDSHGGVGLFLEQPVKKGCSIVTYDPDWVKVIAVEDILFCMDEATSDKILKYAYDGANHHKYGLPEGYVCYDLDDCRFLNHSDDPSIIFDYEAERYVATRDLFIGDELTTDYREFCTVGKYCAEFLKDEQ